MLTVFITDSKKIIGLLNPQVWYGPFNLHGSYAHAYSHIRAAKSAKLITDVEEELFLEGLRENLQKKCNHMVLTNNKQEIIAEFNPFKQESCSQAIQRIKDSRDLGTISDLEFLALEESVNALREAYETIRGLETS